MTFAVVAGGWQPVSPIVLGVTRELEGEAERDLRRYQRGLFDGVARLYDATRPGHAGDFAGFVTAPAGIGAGTPVLAAGCGTERLARAGGPLCGG